MGSNCDLCTLLERVVGLDATPGSGMNGERGAHRRDKGEGRKRGDEKPKKDLGKRIGFEYDHTATERTIGFSAVRGSGLTNGRTKRRRSRAKGPMRYDEDPWESPDTRMEFEFDHTSVRLCQSCLRNLLPEWMIETGRTRRRGPFEF